MKKTNTLYLEDILEAINKVESFTKNLSFLEFEKDDKTQFAVFHALEIVGEASNKLSKDFIDENQDFPVRQAIELRNFLIHGYDKINLAVVWKTIEENLPPLKEQVKKLLF